jgi:hypothetical protein
MRFAREVDGRCSRDALPGQTQLSSTPSTRLSLIAARGGLVWISQVVLFGLLLLTFFRRPPDKMMRGMYVHRALFPSIIPIVRQAVL